jgi:hypothetical protein
MPGEGTPDQQVLELEQRAATVIPERIWGRLVKESPSKAIVVQHSWALRMHFAQNAIEMIVGEDRNQHAFQ